MVTKYKIVTTQKALTHSNHIHYHIEYQNTYWFGANNWKYVHGSYSTSLEEVEKKVKYLKDNKATTLEPKTERVV